MNIKRNRRIAEEIKKIISNLILSGLKDPRIDKMASVTAVNLSGDYSIAKIYISAMTDEKRKDAVEGLNSASGFIKREISKNIDLRIMPELIFLEDDSIEQTFEMEKIFDKIKKEKDD